MKKALSLIITVTILAGMLAGYGSAALAAAPAETEAPAAAESSAAMETHAATEAPAAVETPATAGKNAITEKNAATEAPVQEAAFKYEHDPRENPRAMEDIVENPDAVYGFSPNPESKRLGSYAEFDWTDPEVVEKGRNERIEYHKSIESMYTMLRQMRDEGKSIEAMARALSAERNRLRLEAYKDNPEGLKAAREGNLAKYGNENGPTVDYLYEKYGSWEKVLVNAFGTNPGMDACTGLYDDYFDLYVELGFVNAAVE